MPDISGELPVDSAIFSRDANCPSVTGSTGFCFSRKYSWRQQGALSPTYDILFESTLMYHATAGVINKITKCILICRLVQGLGAFERCFRCFFVEALVAECRNCVRTMLPIIVSAAKMWKQLFLFTTLEGFASRKFPSHEYHGWKRSRTEVSHQKARLHQKAARLQQ